MITALLATAILTSHAPAARTIEFSGFTWEVKRAVEEKAGPGPNLFSDSEEAVFVDSQGRLHLKVLKTDKGWASSEVFLRAPLGYGAYTFELDTPADAVDDNVVLGLFTYGASEDYNHREIDFEVSRWGDPKAANMQMVIQPYDTVGNIVRYEMPRTTASSSHMFNWTKDKIDFTSMAKNWFKRWTYDGRDNPVPGDETVHINLWMFQGKDPVSGRTNEVIIKKFSFKR
jgi:hypothetical protein